VSSLSGIASPTGSPDSLRESKRVLVVDTDPGVRWAIERGLSRGGFEVMAASNLGDALHFLEENEFDGIILEILPEAGLTHETLSMVVDKGNSSRVICVSVESSPQIVIECMKRGAVNFLPKPFSMAELKSCLTTALASASDTPVRRRVTHPEVTQADEASLLIGISPATQELRASIVQIAKTDLNCLVRGESGTGKDMVAREIHRLSARRSKPFVKVNCTALPDQLLESELFGYEKGAFTGAVTSKPGRFELAHRGIIFMDEIGDVHPSLQAKLLQVIEHKEFTKLGGTRPINVDVQIIAATNADLEQKTREGSFRDDLYFRLNEVCLWVPPLKDRSEDIPLLVHHFMKKHGRYSSSSSVNISGDELDYLTALPWQGNVRELESTIKRALALGTSLIPTGRASQSQANQLNRAASAPPIEGTAPAQVVVPSAYSAILDDPDRLRELLEVNQWNRRKVAETLGISYQTLRRRIEKFGLDASV
jgi:DNA-binding NtrC family response regulator